MTSALKAAPMSNQRLQDFYALDSLYTHEERIIRDSVREFVRAEILPFVGEWWQEGHFHLELSRKFGELGVLGMTLPEKYGGAEASYTAYGLTNREIEYGDSGMRSFVSVQSSLVMYPIYRYGSEALRKKWLPRLASGEPSSNGRSACAHNPLTDAASTLSPGSVTAARDPLLVRLGVGAEP
jgi:glutaryl-CoA dehydrogenase